MIWISETLEPAVFKEILVIAFPLAAPVAFLFRLCSQSGTVYTRAPDQAKQAGYRKSSRCCYKLLNFPPAE
jgi:hypothetical protein